MYVATKRWEPGGPVSLSEREALDFIARNMPAPGPDDKYQRYALLKIFAFASVEWTPTVFQALVDVGVPLREPDLDSLLTCARLGFKLSAEEVVSAIRNEAALDPKRRPLFDSIGSSDEAAYIQLSDATAGVRRASARYLSKALTKKFSKPSR